MAAPVTVFTDAVIPESAGGASDVPTCVVCGVAMPGAHGNARYCDQHRPGTARTTGNASGSKGKSGRPSKDDQLTRDLAQLLTMVGAGVSLVESYDGMVILDRATPTATALVEASKTSPAVRKALEQLVTASAWSAVGMAIVGMVAPILAHHGVLPMNPEQVAATFLTPETVAVLHPPVSRTMGVQPDAA